MKPKRKQPKNKSWVQLASNFVAQWPEVLEGVELSNMPIHYLKAVHIQLKNHITITIDIVASLKKFSRKHTADMVKIHIKKYHSSIKNVDLSFDVEKLKRDMKNKTANILDKTFKDV